jgi:hypothetical protein
MSRVSYFQRFSQAENHATNNTLLVLRYFYQSSPFKIQRALTELVEKDLSIGLSFQQQVRGEMSVPDALITQEPLHIYVETKRGGQLDADQVQRHLSTIANSGARGGDILIGITKEQIAEADRKVLAENAAAQGIAFAAVTFSQVAEALRQQCAPHESELLAIVEDYESYLADERLMEEREKWLVVFPCGTSIAENVRFGLYYEPPSRPCKRYSFIGVYHRKVVSYVGKVVAIAVASFKESGVDFSQEEGTLTDEHKERIKAVVEATRYYDLKAEPNRYYLVDHFTGTDLKKTSSGGIMSYRYLDLSCVLPSFDPRKNYSTDELAAALKGRTWG